MSSTLITHLQIFGIGFSFGIAGPCFLVCTPILVSFVLGKNERIPRALADITVFLSGRLAAYIFLGALAGLSGGAIRRFIESGYAPYLSKAGGLVSIALGAGILFARQPAKCSCPTGRSKAYNYSGLFALGFIIGISPCAPLVALLFEVALMSKSAFDGALYTFSFGLGTLVSGLIVAGTLAGVLGGTMRRLIRSHAVSAAFRIACAALLIILGMTLIAGKYSL